jgi:hypothetical protein
MCETANGSGFQRNKFSGCASVEKSPKQCRDASPRHIVGANGGTLSGPIGLETRANARLIIRTRGMLEM